MFRKRKVVVALLLVIAMIFTTFLTGCGSSKVNDQKANDQSIQQESKGNEEAKTIENKDSGDKFITVLVEGGSPAYAVAKQTADEFKNATGYEVRIDAVPYIGVFDKLRAEVSSAAGAYDVATIDILWFPALAKGLLPIDDLLTDEVKRDLLPGLVEGGSYQNKVYGMPVWTNCKTLLYRKDLFEDPKEKEAFQKQYGYELQPPKTWKEYRDVAKFFTRDTNNDGQIDIYGTSVFGANNGDSVASWLDHVMQAGARPLVVGNNGEVLVNKEPYVKALEFLTTILREDKSVPPGALEMASAETSELFWNGKLAMMLAWGHFYVPSNDPQKSKVAGKVGTAPMIAGDAGVGAIPGPWYQVVPSSSKKQDIAKKYLSFLYEKNALYMDALGVAARKSVFDEFGKKSGYEHLKSLSDTLGGPQTQNRPALAEWSQIENEALVPAVQYALSGKKTPQEALDWAAEMIKEILQK
ncbi:ABC transporter substrate-binding protein [Petroclostridium xylanilyticum]|uniref:ABC transporter substrate-binding protein n=1 Tax=Petroclostridium xylanilyticum TaxID=1792311 RepID=UPI001FA8264B|nr:sugar ABC transporter substrate-binding protein [Petroclostridium xylanilyticum]